MSNILSSIYEKAVEGFHVVESQAEAIWAKLESIPGFKPVEDAAKSKVKQELSNAFAFVDSSLKPHYGEAISLVESGFDTGMLGIVGGVSPAAVPLAQRSLPLINAGIEKLANQMRAAIDLAEAEAKANWNLPPPTSAAKPSVAGVVGDLIDPEQKAA